MEEAQSKNTTTVPVRVYRSPLETLLIDAVILLLSHHRYEALHEWTPAADYESLQRLIDALHVERGEA